MSRLKEHVDELCPGGVERLPLEKVAPIVRESVEVGTLGNDEFVGVQELLQNKEGVQNDLPPLPKDGKVHRFQPGDTLIGNIRPYLKKIWLADREGGTSGDVIVVRPGDGVDATYIYFVLSADSFFEYDMNHSKGSKMPRGERSAIGKYPVPVPPIEVQREIVRVLDAMQELDDALESELERRDEQLWQLRNRVYSDSRFELKPLRSIGKFERGRRFTRAEMNGTGVGCVHYGDIYTGYKYFASEPLNRLDENIHKQLRFATKGDVIIAATSENAEDVCTAIAWLGDEDVAIHDDCQKFCHDQNPLYMAMFFNSEPFIRQKQRFTTESKVVRIAGDEMAQIEIPLPPRDVQDRIAHAMLQSIGLMKTIEDERSARRKQFEYYRDRLLDFPERAV